MTDLVTSWIRTVVPSVTGYVLARLAAVGIDVDGEALTLVLTGAFTGVWYALVRLVESRWASAGWLLGRAKTPTY
jgi:hypothetical protein